MSDKHQTKSQYTTDRQIPGAFEGETVTRRRFMTTTTHVAGAVAASAFLLPPWASPSAGVRAGHREWQDIGPVGDFGLKDYTPKTIQITDGVGSAGRGTAYIRRYNPKVDSQPLDQYNRFIAISSSCMHLGCPVQYVPAAERFICPCHGGVYNVEGKVAGGPPVRPLDRYYTRVRRGRVELGPKYSVNSELDKFSPRDPGEPLDGIGQYLYPSRPTLRKDPNQSNQ